MHRRDLLGLAAGSILGSGRGSRTAHAADRPQSTDQRSAFAPLAALDVAQAREVVLGADGTTAFLAVEDGFAVVDLAAPRAPELLAERRGDLATDDADPMRQVQDLAVDGDDLLVVGPAHPGFGGLHGAIRYDVSDPAAPRRVAVHPTAYPIHNADLSDGLAYLTANDDAANPLVIVEMTSEPRVVGTWSPLDADPAWEAVPSRVRPLHDVTVHGTVAYCSYWDAGTWLVDVADPASPRALSRIGERSAATLADVEAPVRESVERPGNHHSAAVDEAGSLLAIGHEAWDDDGDGAGGPGGIDLVDVTDPTAPVVRSHVEPPATADPTRDGVWTTAHNADLRGGRLYSAWYQGGVRVHDVADPERPEELAAWRDPSRARFWTAQAGDGAVVASSMGTEDAMAALYVFPEPTPTPQRVTATPGLRGFGATAAVVGIGLGALVAAARRR